MEIIDAQIHTWMSDRPTRPWISGYREGLRDRLPHLMHAGQTNTNEMAILEMAEVGVDAALLSPVGPQAPTTATSSKESPGIREVQGGRLGRLAG